MAIPGVGSEGVPLGVLGPNTGILVQDSPKEAPIHVTEMALGLAGATGNMGFSRNPLWATAQRMFGTSKASARPEFMENLSHLRESFQLGGMNQGIRALARTD